MTWTKAKAIEYLKGGVLLHLELGRQDYAMHYANMLDRVENGLPPVDDIGEEERSADCTSRSCEVKAAQDEEKARSAGL